MTRGLGDVDRGRPARPRASRADATAASTGPPAKRPDLPAGPAAARVPEVLGGRRGRPWRGREPGATRAPRRHLDGAEGDRGGAVEATGAASGVEGGRYSGLDRASGEAAGFAGAGVGGLDTGGRDTGRGLPREARGLAGRRGPAGVGAMGDGGGVLEDRWVATAASRRGRGAGLRIRHAGRRGDVGGGGRSGPGGRGGGRVPATRQAAIGLHRRRVAVRAWGSGFRGASVDQRRGLDCRGTD